MDVASIQLLDWVMKLNANQTDEAEGQHGQEVDMGARSPVRTRKTSYLCSTESVMENEGTFYGFWREYIT